jgi:hypothetical protein
VYFKRKQGMIWKMPAVKALENDIVQGSFRKNGISYQSFNRESGFSKALITKMSTKAASLKACLHSERDLSSG